MYGPIQKAIDEVQQVIPEEILLLALLQKNRQNFNRQVSIPVMIREEVIDRRVRQDIDLAGMVLITIPLAGCPLMQVDDYNTIIEIPMNRTQGRSISSCNSVSFTGIGSYGYNYGQTAANFSQSGNYGRSVVTDAISNMQAANAPIPITSTANVRLISENTILINDILPRTNELFLECCLVADTELSQFTPQYYGVFAEFVVLAAKAYIYRKLNLALDLGQLIGGQQLGRVREVIDEYRDAEQSYQDFKKDRLAKILFLNDRERMRKNTRMLVGGNN